MKTLGQETGGSSGDRQTEAKRLLEIIRNSDLSRLSAKDLAFFRAMMAKPPEYIPTGRQIFWLRDIRDRLL